MSASPKRATLGLVLCGFGRAGQIHFNGIRRSSHLGCRLLYVVDLVQDEAVASRIQARLSECGVQHQVKLIGSKDYEEVAVKDPNVDAVMVATPTNEHEHFVRIALSAGKAVFCEKPIASNMTAVAECYALAEKMTKPLFCAFNRRYDAAMASLRERVRADEIGRLYQLRITSRDSPLPSMAYLRISKGIFHDCAIHDIDMACWIVGEGPREVYAQGSAFHPDIAAMGDVDTVAIVLKFPGGVVASIDLSRHSQYGYDQRLEALGSKGMLRVNNVEKDSLHSFTSEGSLSSTFQHSFPQRYEQAYLQELEDFLTIVRDTPSSSSAPCSPRPVSREEVLLSGLVADACEKSLKERRPVILEPDGRQSNDQ